MRNHLNGSIDRMLISCRLYSVLGRQHQVCSLSDYSRGFPGVWDNVTFVQTPGKNYTGVDSIYEILGLLQNISIGRKERNFIDYGLKYFGNTTKFERQCLKQRTRS